MVIAQWRKDLFDEATALLEKHPEWGDREAASRLTPKYGKHAKSGRITKNTIIGIRNALKAQDQLDNGEPIDFRGLSIAPYQIERPDHQTTDWDQWETALSKLEDKRYVKVAHLTDMHRPFHDENACALAYEMVYDFQPDVVPVGLDDLDFPLESVHWKPDPDIKFEIDDWIERAYHDWTPHIDMLDTIAPNAYKPHVPGNHNWRAYDLIAASGAHRTLSNSFADVIRSDNRVLYFGRIDALEVGNLTVMHIPRSTKYPAYATLENNRFQFNIVSGHIHRPDESTVMVKHPVSAWISGCLCDLKPHYGKMKEYSTWQHGITLLTVDMKTGNVSGRNYNFQHDDTHIWCDTVHKTYSIKKQAKESRIAA